MQPRDPKAAHRREEAKTGQLLEKRLEPGRDELIHGLSGDHLAHETATRIQVCLREDEAGDQVGS